jgi:hypothetical protein
MNTREWIETLLPRVAERFYKELLLLDPVPEEYAATPTAAALYHLSRHTQRMTVTRASKATKGKLPPPCPQPLPGCKAHCLAQALIACQPGAPGIAAATVTDYADVASSTKLELDKILEDIAPATSDLLGLLRPQAPGLRRRGRKLLHGAKLRLQALVRIRQDMDSWGSSVLDEFSTTFTKLDSPNKRHHRHHIDRITAALLGGFTDEEIAELVPDGREAGDAEARVANRRKKLTGTRQGGRSGKPGRPRKVRTET